MEVRIEEEDIEGIPRPAAAVVGLPSGKDERRGSCGSEDSDAKCRGDLAGLGCVTSVRTLSSERTAEAPERTAEACKTRVSSACNSQISEFKVASMSVASILAVVNEMKSRAPHTNSTIKSPRGERRDPNYNSKIESAGNICCSQKSTQKLNTN
jgi:hypothetical protein